MSYTAQEERLIAEANEIGKDAVGLPFTIKLSESGRANKVTCSGVIVECGFGYFRKDFAKNRLQAIFKVVMEVGPNKIRREFHVQRVPQ